MLFFSDYTPTNTNFTTNLKGAAVTLGKYFNLTCSAVANPLAKFRFYRGQEILFNTTTGDVVAVYTISLNERVNQVDFSCIPYNDFGEGPARFITVTVFCKYMIWLFALIVVLDTSCYNNETWSYSHTSSYRAFQLVVTGLPSTATRNFHVYQENGSLFWMLVW